MLALLGITGGVLFAAHLLQETSESLSSVEALVDYQPGGITEIFATDKDPKTGKSVLLGRIYGRYREFKPINEIPEVVKYATVAIEDERFYEHVGVDIRGIARALYKNYKSGDMKGEGASTLTQQLARNLILKNYKKTITRKIQEALLSIQIERTFSKEEILEMYLNEVYYGANAYGIQAAAKVYFNKPLDKLSLSEAALLAGLPQQPSEFEPFKHFDPKKKEWKDTVVLNRRDTVLSKMLSVKEADLAQEEPILVKNLPKIKDITAKDIEAAKKEKNILAAEPDPENAKFLAPYFTNHVLRLLAKQYGKDKVYNGGLKVYTTLNYQMQQEAERALINGVQQAGWGGVTEGALVSVEPKTGYVRALVGGIDYKKNQYNNATQGRRQPGSTFKTFVYAAAFSTGKYSPSSYISDSFVRYGTWTPKNYAGGYHGTVSLRTAFTYSYNIPAVKLANQIGIGRVLDTARRMGVDTSKMEKQKNLALALGAGEVSPLEMASAYSTFPNQGNHAQPMFIIRVIDAEGNELPGFEPRIDKQVLPETTVAQMSELMSAVVEQGTAASAKGIKEVPGAHGKTGTTNENRDAWFVGYTPELSTAVWVCGMKKVKKGNRMILQYPPMARVTGGQVCAPIWARFMKAAVPIQQKYQDTLRQAPEQVIPSNAALLAKAKEGTPTSTPTTETKPTLEIPRSQENTPSSVANDGANRDSNANESSEESTQPDNSTPSDREENLAPKSGDSAPTADTGVRGGDSFPRTNTTTTRPSGGVSSVQGNTEADSGTGVTRNTRIRTSGNGLPKAEKRTTSVLICSDSGALASKWCPIAVERPFSAEHAPKSTCKQHKPMPGDG
jgi:1A family penicillin-binding protein